jgi:hypothetical protein
MKRSVQLFLSMAVVIVPAFFAIASVTEAQQTAPLKKFPSQGQPPSVPKEIAPKEKMIERIKPNEQYISCPCQEVRTEITTPLPEGWWNTPQGGKLVQTKVENIGGSPTLMCGYNAYNTVVYIMRTFPAGTANCKPLKGGFRCY